MIQRTPRESAVEAWDLVIVGAGIHGAMLALLAARQGLKTLLLERGDFGEATSWNTLRIVHGGFRYLQSADLLRFRESVAERRWFLQNFLELIEPLPCLLPLYGDGVKRPAVLKAALILNDLLASQRNVGVDPGRWLPNGEVLESGETIARFPLVDPKGLRGGAVWYDAVMANSSRVLIEIIKWAVELGARALNYVEAAGYQRHGSRSRVTAIDQVSGERLTFDASMVANCAGPWCRALAASWDRDRPELFRPSLAFNLILDRSPVSEGAVAVTPRRAGARTYFLHRWQDRLFAGTSHTEWSGPLEAPAPSDPAIAAFLGDLNEAVPELRLEREEVVRVMAGFTPIRRSGTLDFSDRPLVLDHASRGGPEGLVSLSGVKFTTGRRAAERTCRLVVRKLERSWKEGFPARMGGARLPGPAEFRRLIDADQGKARDLIARIGREESVVFLDDFLLRRTEWGVLPTHEPAIRDLVQRVLGAATLSALRS